jgi:hypothetical protein
MLVPSRPLLPSPLVQGPIGPAQSPTLEVVGSADCGLAVTTLSRPALQERADRWLKLVSGAVMLARGLVLVFRPGWLA